MTGVAGVGGQAFVILVDTSVWVEVFRRPPRVRLESEVDLDEVVTALPIIQEVLQGFRDEAAFRTAREAMLALPVVESPLPRDRFLEAAELYRAARRAGQTVRSATDCLIAACALRRQLLVLHFDRDYDLLSRVSPLRSRRIRLRATKA
ncbi:MAG: type II toxin-antitoxin system VapC family toxin [Acidimicrobiia bacterium]